MIIWWALLILYYKFSSFPQGQESSMANYSHFCAGEHSCFTAVKGSQADEDKGLGFMRV